MPQETATVTADPAKLALKAAQIADLEANYPEPRDPNVQTVIDRLRADVAGFAPIVDQVAVAALAPRLGPLAPFAVHIGEAIARVGLDALRPHLVAFMEHLHCLAPFLREIGAIPPAPAAPAAPVPPPAPVAPAAAATPST